MNLNHFSLYMNLTKYDFKMEAISVNVCCQKKIEVISFKKISIINLVNKIAK